MGKYYPLQDSGSFEKDIVSKIRRSLQKGMAVSVAVLSHSGDKGRPQVDADVGSRGQNYHCNWEEHKHNLKADMTKDERILRMLENDPRMTLTKIAETLGHSPSTIHDDYWRLTKDRKLVGLWVMKAEKGEKTMKKAKAEERRWHTT